jgi:flagellar hook-associated protein 3 FlgL
MLRVTSQVLSDQAVLAMRSALSRLAHSQAQLASGRRIQSPADDPSGHAAATRLEARRAAAVQFSRQADQAYATLAATDTLLQRLQPILGRAEELAVSGADGAKGPSERTSMAAEVNQLLEELVSVANTTEDGRYLLGGQETLTAPLSFTRDVAGKITAAAWNPRGVDGPVRIDVSAGMSVQVNTGGTAVLGAATDPTFVPALLISLRDALAANNGDAARTAIDTLRAAESRTGTAVADTGGRLRLVEQVQVDLDGERLAASSALSAVMDADLADVAVQLSQQQVAYQAALNAAAQAIQPSLLDFLR